MEQLLDLPASRSPFLANQPVLGDERRQNTRRSSGMILLSLVLAVILLYFTLRGLDWPAFWRTIQNGNYEFLLMTVPIGSANYFIRAWRWSIFVRAERKIPIRPIFWANMVGYMANAFVPARPGELLRSALLGEKSGLRTSFVLATALAERLLDTIALVLIGCLSLLWLGNVPPVLADAVRIMALADILLMVAIIAAPLQEKSIQRLINWLPLPSKISKLVSEQLTHFLVGMRVLQSWRRLSLFALLTACIWLVDAVSTTIGVRIISQTLSLSQAFILLSALGLSSAIPSTPGYVGVFQFVAVTVLEPFGFSRSEALAYILCSQIVYYLVVSCWGVLGLWQLKQMNTIMMQPDKDSKDRTWQNTKTDMGRVPDNPKARERS
jgi:glycosyltransferase 2 family protein